MNIGYVHHSGRFSFSPAALGRGLVAQANMPGVDVIGVTEVANPRRKRGARDALARIGWGFAGDSDSECGLAYDREVYALLDAREVKVTNVKTWTTKGKLRAPFKVLLCSLRIRATSQRITIGVAHTPSAVQSGSHWRKNGRARQHRSGLKGIHRAMRAYGKSHPARRGGRILSMDLNLDVRRAVWRRYLLKNFPGMRLVHDATYPATHRGGRSIDVVLVSRSLNPLRWFRRKRVRVVRASDSDHRSVMVRLRLK